uniref:Uncharacterized protein n=1 Tax=Anguilla anguilla TaxID=7936 RepID=A0A0E9RW64_ANGAN
MKPRWMAVKSVSTYTVGISVVYLMVPASYTSATLPFVTAIALYIHQSDSV